MFEWKFRRRQGSCALCQLVFAEGDPHVSTLVALDRELTREDCCLACWPQRAQGALFWWRTRHETARRHGPALNLEALEGLFSALEARSERELRELRYVLCLLLVRKRRLRIERIGEDQGGEFLEVRRPRREERQRVDVFDFTPEQMRELGGRLQEVFESGRAETSAGGAEGDLLPAAPTPA